MRSLKRGMFFGAVSALFGGAVYALIGFISVLVAEDSPGIAMLIGILVGTAFWGVVGFLVGALGLGRAEAGADATAKRWTVPRILGWFLLRMIVGLLVGMCVASLVQVAGLGLTYALYGDILLTPPGDSTFFRVLNWMFSAAPLGSAFGALVGSWLETEGYKTSLTGSIAGGVLAAVAGTTLLFVSIDQVMLPLLMIGAFAGLVGGILGMFILKLAVRAEILQRETVQ